MDGDAAIVFCNSPQSEAERTHIPDVKFITPRVSQRRNCFRAARKPAD